MATDLDGGIPGLGVRSGIGIDRDSKAQAEQIRSISVEGVGGRLGVVPNAIMLDIDYAPASGAVAHRVACVRGRRGLIGVNDCSADVEARVRRALGAGGRASAGSAAARRCDPAR